MMVPIRWRKKFDDSYNRFDTISTQDGYTQMDRQTHRNIISIQYCNIVLIVLWHMINIQCIWLTHTQQNITIT